ncbi:MAG: MlaD family protein, partial [Myxococcota bacterium]
MSDGNQTAALEARVGAFVLVGAGVLAGFLVLLSDWSLTPSRRIDVDYGYSGGLKAGAPVILSGVRIGRVDSLSLLTEAGAASVAELGRRELPVVRASLAIDAAAAEMLKADARFFVGMQGLIGEAYVEVAPGTGSTDLEPDRPHRGVDAPKLHVMILRFSSTLATVSGLVGGADADRLSQVADSVQTILSGLERIVAEDGDAIGQLLSDL